MDYWPTRYSEKPDYFKKGKGRSYAKDQAKGDSDSHAYPLVEQGSVGAANLIHHGRKVEWAFLSQHDSGRRIHTRGPSMKIFPATSPKALSTSGLSIKQRAEQGAHFLRTQYPDIDIASDLIRGELLEDARHTSDLMELNPYCGNSLAVITCSERTRRKSAFLAFPMGPTRNDLNVSPLTYSKRDHVVFQPSAKTVKTFDTPIDQIIGYSGEVLQASQGTFVAVRTAGSTHITKLQLESGSPASVSLHTLATWTRSHTEQQHVVDMVFPRSFGTNYVSIFTVTDYGHIYNCFANSQHSTQLMYSPPTDAPNDKFWRIVPMSSAESLLLLSSSILSLIDFRGKSEGLQLFTSTREPLTCAQAPGADHIVRALTTSELVWIDNRFTQKPLFSYKHGRQKDRTLQMHTMSFHDGPLTFLTSRKSNLVTVYDVAQDELGVTRMKTPVYSLPPFNTEGDQCIGSALIRHPSDTNNESALLLRLSERGSIHRLDLTLSDAEEYAGRSHIWSNEVQQLEAKAENLRQEYGQLGGRLFNEADLDLVVQRVLGMKEADTADTAEAVYNALDNMQSFWSTLDEPVDNMLTTSDVAFRSGSEPVNASRTDFFTQNKLGSTRGYRALVQQRIPIKQIANQAAWHSNIYSIVHRFLSELSTSPEETFERLKAYDLRIDDYRTGASIRRESEAREQLTLDLSLSVDVYSPHPIRQTLEFSGNAEDEAFETMSRATEAMSIGIPEPPPVHFGFLRPVFGKGQEHYAEDKDDHDGKIDHPLGARLLLKDWEIGTDPESYVYYDPYGINGIPVPRPIQHVRLPPISETESRSIQRTQSQRAPPVIASTVPMAPPPIMSSQLARVAPAPWQSQDTIMSSKNAPRVRSQPGVHVYKDPSQSQDLLIPNTQVLPGPFGGRPVVKKKPVKKRLGGF